MYISDIALQTRVFLYSIGLGMLLGLVYDVFRIIRLIIGNKRNAVFFQDFIFFVLSTFFAFLFFLVINNGRLRFFEYLAMVLGFFSYYFTVGSVLINLSSVVIPSIKSAFRAVARVISAPIRLVVKLFIGVKNKMSPIFAKMMKKIKNSSKTLLKK